MKSESPNEITATVNAINEALSRYSDKAWNYSRISLQVCTLAELTSPYVLWVERLDVGTKPGKGEFRAFTDEMTWGRRHSDELGILEVVSLRLNSALLESSSDDDWENQRPIVRVAKKQELEEQGITLACWYQVREVTGEDFDNR